MSFLDMLKSASCRASQPASPSLPSLAKSRYAASWALKVSSMCPVNQAACDRSLSPSADSESSTDLRISYASSHLWAARALFPASRACAVDVISSGL